MTPRKIGLAALALVLAFPGCDRSGGGAPGERMAASAAEESDDGSSGAAPGDLSDRRPFSEIGESETVRFTGTEPFWGGEVTGSQLTYRTPDNIEGAPVVVERFAGRAGLSYSGDYDGAPFDMMITLGECSDGMSDRTYPYTVTLEVAGDERRGCAWTSDNPRTAPPGYEP